jgi:hypothetical protein
MRVFANKDTALIARMVQKWRKPTNPISQGKLGSFVEPKQWLDTNVGHQAFVADSETPELNAFSIGTPPADTGVREIIQRANRQREIFCSSHLFHLPDSTDN